MNKILCFLLVLLIHHSAAAQIGIGTRTPDPNAILDLSSSNKGLLIPRLSTAAIQSMRNPSEGLLVYDTSYSAFFYNDGTRWLPVSEANYDSTCNEYLSSPQETVNIPVSGSNASTTALSGVLYDNGGPSGNYGTNRFDQYTINVAANDSVVGFKVVVEYLNTAAPGDYLEISTIGDASRLKLSGTTTGTYFFHSANNLVFSFISDYTVNMGGFKLTWSVLTTSVSATQPPPLFGWYYNQRKNAVRGGTYIGNNWKTDTLGRTSFGFGENVLATGRNSIALGKNSKAMGNNSFVVGPDGEAYGNNAASIGYYAYANGNNSIALGSSARASGDYSAALGYFSQAVGTNSVVIANSIAHGDYSIAMGYSSIATGNNSIAIGTYSKSTNYNAIAIGYSDSAIGNLSLAMGQNTRAIGDNATSMGYFTKAIGEFSTAIGNSNDAGGRSSVAMGSYTKANGQSSTTMGSGTYTGDDYSTALGRNTRATGYNSTAMGYETWARSYHSTAIGLQSTAWNVSTAIGYGVVAYPYASMAIGRYNDSIASASTAGWSATEPLFMIGNGSSNTSRSNAFMVLKNGNTGLGTNTPKTKLHIDNGSDADFASTSGYLVIGDVAGTNIVFDNNEIQARNNGAPGTLYFQHGGGSLDVGGAAYKPGGGSWSASSDARLKQNITPYREGLQQLIRINPVSFQYNALSGYDTQKQYIGVIAQELKEVAPYMVGSFNKNGTEYLNVDNSSMTYMLINAVKEQQALIDRQQAEIKEMKAAIEALQKNKNY